MRVVLVANTLWSVVIFRPGLLKTLTEMDVEVLVVAPPDDTLPQAQALNVRVIPLDIAAKGTNPLGDLALMQTLTRLYRELRPDIVFHYTIKPNIYGSIAAWRAGIPSVAVTTGLGYAFINENLVARIANALYKVAFRFPREVWFLNQDDRRDFVARRLVSPDRTRVLPGEGIDLDKFAPRVRAVRDGKLRFLLIARLLRDKGVGEYVDAARLIRRRYPHAVFQLLGATGVANPSAISAAEVQAWVEEGVVEYLGTTLDVRPIIAEADCVVLPSYREGVPRTLLEAASMGKPVVATRAIGCREVVDDGVTGYLCDVGDASDLAQKLERIVTLDEAARTAMGARGRAFVAERFDERNVVAIYLDTMRRFGVL
jgi:glycosyltransferase involved in cell wall biosynthesis